MVKVDITIDEAYLKKILFMAKTGLYMLGFLNILTLGFFKNRLKVAAEDIIALVGKAVEESVNIDYK